MRHMLEQFHQADAVHRPCVKSFPSAEAATCLRLWAAWWRAPAARSGSRPSRRQKLYNNITARSEKGIHDNQVFPLYQVLSSNPKQCPRAYISRCCLFSKHLANGSTTHIHRSLAPASRPPTFTGIQNTSHAIAAGALALPISI
jgi:hypothetical protein